MPLLLPLAATKERLVDHVAVKRKLPQGGVGIVLAKTCGACKPTEWPFTSELSILSVPLVSSMLT